MMEIRPTRDGSNTIYSQVFDQGYHSHHGAVAESALIYIELGLLSLGQKTVKILEIGMGTGLNALLSYRTGIEMEYWAIEAFPVPISIANELNFAQNEDEKLFFEAVHAQSEFQHGTCKFKKLIQKLEETELPTDYFDLVYFDAFSPEAQPEMWSEEVFQKMANTLKTDGVLTTYCTKGLVKRNLKTVGFQIKKHPGPWGKRDVLRAVKTL